MSNASAVVRSVILFLVAGVCEIGGGWLVWKWLRDHRPGWWGLLGGLVLVLYGVIPTLQTSHFGRIYAVYGGFFIVLSLLWVGLRRRPPRPYRCRRGVHRPGRRLRDDGLAQPLNSPGLVRGVFGSKPGDIYHERLTGRCRGCPRRLPRLRPAFAPPR